MNADENEELRHIVQLLRNLGHYLSIGSQLESQPANRHDEDPFFATSYSRRSQFLWQLCIVRRVLRQLPLPQRDLLFRVGIQAMTIDEAGRRLGMAPEAVTQCLWRVAKKIQEAWHGTGGGGR